jgi:hypothetical protein
LRSYEEGVQSHLITHNLPTTGICCFSGLEGDGEFPDPLHPFPDRFGAGMTIAFAPEKAAETGN